MALESNWGIERHDDARSIDDCACPDCVEQDLVFQPRRPSQADWKCFWPHSEPSPAPVPVWQQNLAPWQNVTPADVARREEKRQAVVEEIVRTGDFSLIPRMQSYVAPPALVTQHDIDAMLKPAAPEPAPVKGPWIGFDEQGIWFRKLDLSALRKLDRRQVENLVLLVLMIGLLAIIFA